MGRRLFIGLVTHDSSRFREAAVRQLDSLVAVCRSNGWEVETLVSARDDYDPARFPVTRGLILRSALSQAALEYRWRRYLATGAPEGALREAARWLRDSAVFVGTAAVRSARYLAPWPGAAVGRLHGTTAIVRLLNIDLSHLRVLTAAVETGADWVLVLEDDARMVDPTHEFPRLLAALESAQAAGVGYVTASRSIGHAELGIERLLGPVDAGHRSAALPITNTVCAVAYPARTAAWFAERIVGDGLLPVIPIDWRLNRALMDAVGRGELGAGSCWLLDPAPFTQGSMH